MDNGLKKFYFNILLTTDKYFFRQEDMVLDRFNEIIRLENIKCDKIHGYLIVDDLGLEEIKYLLLFTTSHNLDEIAIRILEKLSKQTILLNYE